jgi:hypothetical protein
LPSYCSFVSATELAVQCFHAAYTRNSNKLAIVQRLLATDFERGIEKETNRKKK